MVADTMRQYKAANVESAAAPLFSQSDIHRGTLPKEITSLPVFAGESENIDSWHITTNALMFCAGGGFGHWGIVVCQAGHAGEATNSLHAIVIPWETNVFFWKEFLKSCRLITPARAGLGR
jgi:hypothetical protein